ncbi:MAG: nicotinate-nucleotide adenylyltransferase [Gammaproteobacteria bacterium]|nr:nicotinate-nucleotide adenylyltransferase [Gammaproteobacteria bacterium]
MTTKPIGIFGGTFDPVHYGHLQVANEVYKQLNLQEIKFIPCNQSPHKEQPIATPKQRVAMLELATKSHPEFTIDTREIDRGGKSYMIDTLASLKEDYPNTPLCLIISQDAFAKFNTWHKWQEIIKLVNLIVANRPDSQPITAPEILALLKDHQTADRIQMISINPLPISATAIRKLAATKHDLNQLTPNKVCDYIKIHNIYHN